MDNIFRVVLLACAVAITVALFLLSENGRYQFVKSGSSDVIIDTRTGEYWMDAGTVHIDARHNHVDSIGGPSVTESKKQ
jgi:hypothetical protein